MDGYTLLFLLPLLFHWRLPSIDCLRSPLSGTRTGRNAARPSSCAAFTILICILKPGEVTLWNCAADSDNVGHVNFVPMCFGLWCSVYVGGNPGHLVSFSVLQYCAFRLNGTAVSLWTIRPSPRPQEAISPFCRILPLMQRTKCGKEMTISTVW